MKMTMTMTLPVDNPSRVQKVQSARDVERNAASPRIPGEGALIIVCQRLPQVTALRH